MANIFKQAENKLVGGLPRTRFSFDKRHTTSFDSGRLIPLLCEETLPGDTWSLDLASLVRMQTPIAPIMDDIYMDFYFFYVPMRIIADKLGDSFEDVITISNGYNGSLNSTVLAGFVAGSNQTNIKPGTVGNYLGLPIGIYSSSIISKISPYLSSGYTMIYNDYFRDENYQDEAVITRNLIPFEHSGDPIRSFSCLTTIPFSVNERHDLFTSVLPAPQKGPSVLLPLGGAAPVLGSSDNPVKFLGLEGGTGLDVSATYRSSDGFTQLNANGINLTTVIDGNSLYADLTQATAATINQLREAIVMQQFLETLARSGSRYSEFIRGFFGVEIGDARVQKPEFICEFHMNINVSEVVQTSGVNLEDGTELGTTGAVSRSSSSSRNLLTYSTPEYGYIYCVACVRHKLSYSQGIDLKWTRLKGTDFYNPAWEGIGEVGVKTRQVLAPVLHNPSYMKQDYSSAGHSVSWDDELGFNEAFAEYKYQTNMTTGILNPVALDGLDYWTLTKAFTTSTISGADIRISNKDTLNRALSIQNQPQFIGDFLFHGSVVRKMRKFSTPGLTRI